MATSKIQKSFRTYTETVPATTLVANSPFEIALTYNDIPSNEKIIAIADYTLGTRGKFFISGVYISGRRTIQILGESNESTDISVVPTISVITEKI